MGACILFLAGPGGLFLNSQVLYPDGGKFYGAVRCCNCLRCCREHFDAARSHLSFAIVDDRPLRFSGFKGLMPLGSCLTVMERQLGGKLPCLLTTKVNKNTLGQILYTQAIKSMSHLSSFQIGLPLPHTESVVPGW